MSFTIQHKRGLKANLPASAPAGEFYFCTDTNEVFVGTGTGMAQINAADAKTINGVPITGTPALGKIPIGQGNGTAVFADPLVQGLQAEGTTATGVNPVLVAGKGTDGNLHDVATDNSGNIAVNVQNFPPTQPVSGSVSVTNLPATQPVSGTVSINPVPAGSNLIGQVEVSDGTNVLGTSLHPVRTDPTGTTTQPVSGSVSVSNFPATQPVSGSVSVSNFPATQPVSAASLPLPTGAATSAKQPALGTAGTPSADVITVQGTASMTPMKVDGSAVTQPVSGTVTSKLQDGSGNAITSTTGALDVNIKSGSSSGTQYAAGSTVTTPTGTVALGQDSSSLVKPLALDASGNLNVNVAAGGTGGNASVSATAAAVPASATMVGGSDGTDLHALKVSATGVLSVDGSAVTQPISAASLPLPTGAATAANQPALGTAGSPSADVITVQGATGMTALKVDGSAVTQPVSGTLTVTQATAANLKVDLSGTAANATAIKVDGSAVTQPVSVASTLGVKLVPQPSGGLSTQSSSTGATATSIKAGAGQLYGWYIGNSNTSAVYVQIFDALTGSVTLGTTAPKMSLFIPAGGAANAFSDTGIQFSSGISFACTTTRSGSAAPTNTVDVNFIFN